ncbi:MAG: glycosyltransferase [Deltaproteobacteria bacterium]|nr:glycosyltransferase [Deltaproteobacteria bacterium]MBW2310396.1 glycosyltransferase [Deltaproteobacteria bacterium]
MKHYIIALLHYSCPPIVGGVEEIIRQHASLFTRYKHMVKLFAGDGELFTDEYDIEINALLGSRNPKILGIHKGLPQSSHELESLSDDLYRYLRQALRSFDVLIAHNVLTMHYNLPLTMAVHKLANTGTIRVVSWNHDSPYYYTRPPVNLDIEQWKILRTYNPAISYVTISEQRKVEFQGLYGVEGIEVIPDGIDPFPLFYLDPKTVKLITEENLFDADLLMIQPSRLHPRKNIELSIRVVRALHDKGLKARLLLTGAFDPHEKKTVGYYNRLRNLSQQLNVERDIVIAAEYYSEDGKELSCEKDVVRDLYLIADLLFMPSLQEGFGIPLLEAGLLRVPIFCSDIHSFREVCEENAQYFSLKDSPSEIADTIIAFINKLSSHRMAHHIKEYYLWDKIYHKILLPFLQRII